MGNTGLKTPNWMHRRWNTRRKTGRELRGAGHRVWKAAQSDVKSSWSHQIKFEFLAYIFLFSLSFSFNLSATFKMLLYFTFLSTTSLFLLSVGLFIFSLFLYTSISSLSYFLHINITISLSLSQTSIPSKFTTIIYTSCWIFREQNEGDTDNLAAIMMRR